MTILSSQNSLIFLLIYIIYGCLNGWNKLADFFVWNPKEHGYHRQGLMSFYGWGVMQYFRHWTRDLQFVLGFRKVESCQRSKEKHCKF